MKLKKIESLVNDLSSAAFKNQPVDPQERLYE